MSSEYADHLIVSDLSDLRGLPLDVEVNADDVGYAHIMRRTGASDSESGTGVSAFNSSI